MDEIKLLEDISVTCKKIIKVLEQIKINKSPLMMKWGATPINKIELPDRTVRLLRAENITNLAELLILSEKDLLNIKKFGRSNLFSVKAAIAILGLNLRDDSENTF